MGHLFARKKPEFKAEIIFMRLLDDVIESKILLLRGFVKELLVIVV
jgi:hypothetical protein